MKITKLSILVAVIAVVGSLALLAAMPAGFAQ